MNLILRESQHVEYYTHLRALFEAVPQLRAYFYVISALKVNGSKDQRLHEDVVSLSGEELYAILRAEDVQFVWGVFSAFEHMPEILPAELPFADCNPQFWQGSPNPQMHGAKFEIVAFDSSCTLFIGVEPTLAALLRTFYPDLADIDQLNAERANKVLQGDARNARA